MKKDSEFSSERLHYRGIAASDAPLIVKWRSDPENYRWFFRASPITVDEHLAWFQRYLVDNSRFDFMIIDAGGQPIGTVGLSSISAESCEVNYMIGEPAARGKGYAAEAVRAMCVTAFKELGVSRIDARVIPGNDASARTAMSAGLIERERVFSIEKG